MSNTDSFIDEVNEEVRREKLYGYLRRYGWIGIVVVLGLVGGAAWNEYRNAQERAAAEAAGDALLTALNETDAEARAIAVAAVGLEGEAATIAALLAAAMQQEIGNEDAAANVLQSLATSGDTPELYRDVAAFKAALVMSGDASARRASLEALATPGRPFRLLASEQLALMALDEGRTDDAVALLRQIEEDAEVSPSLRDRVQTLMVALDVPLADNGSQ